MKSALFSEIGPRERNEDRVLEPTRLNDDSTLIAIADGIGGSDDGALAADLAIQAIKSKAATSPDMASLFHEAQNQIKTHADKYELKSKIGTTLSACRIFNDKLSFGHVGDCRIYILRKTGLITITRDQTEIAALVEKGVFTRREARRYRRRAVLTSALTNYSEYELQEGEFHINNGDRILLISDGVYNSITKRMIVDLSMKYSELHMFASAIRDYVDSSGPTDNFSMLAVEI